MIINKSAVREAMKKNGILTQTELAEMLGISKNQLSLMLSGKYNPLKSNVDKLCTTLQISPFEILEENYDNKMYDHNTYQNVTDYINDADKTYLAEPVTVLELFAGAGGIALGLEQAGLEPIGLIEIDKDCCNTLKKNRPHWKVIHDDVHNVDFKRYNPDIITGGFPCQAFSYAGKKLGFEDTRGTLFYEFARSIKEAKPLMFMAENVRGLMSHDKGRTLETILSVFSDLGYNVQYKLINAVNYSVPQKRERIIIIGTLPGITFEYPKKDKEIKVLKDALKNVPKSKGIQYSDNKKRVIEMVPPGGYWRDLPVEVQKEYMGKSFYSSGGRTGMARRISWDEPCLTLTCSPSQKQTERCHPDETRPFTVREYARIQTFPDDWEFSGSVYSQYKQIGNAVPVRVAYRLGLEMLKAINDYKEKKSSLTEKGA